jgi:hypothetical protein
MDLGVLRVSLFHNPIPLSYLNVVKNLIRIKQNVLDSTVVRMRHYYLPSALFHCLEARLLACYSSQCRPG